jgi:hypothetical protein
MEVPLLLSHEFPLSCKYARAVIGSGSIGLTDVTALTGAIAGAAALALGVVNYLRDTPKIIVKLFWDRSVVNIPGCDPNKLYGLVLVSNVGRRPIYISHAALSLPNGYEETRLVLREGIRGNRLVEGDPPAEFMVSQDGLKEYAKDWRKIRAVVNDSVGKESKSKRPRKSDKPSWAK